MDNLTHTLTGIALGQAGLKRKTRYAFWALIIGSNLPDIDIVTAAGGESNYLKYHRGITHSLLGITVLAAILAAGIFALGRRAAPKKNAPPVNLRWIFLLTWIATACHVLMDYTNSYGIRPFLPLSGRWIALDIMPIVGPYVLLLLIGGLGIPFLLRLVSEEVGQRTHHTAGQRAGAMIALCGIVAIWGVRFLAHRRALEMLDADYYGGEVPRRMGAFPTALNPFDWNGVVETESAYFLLTADTLSNGVDALDAQPLPKAPKSPALEAARKASTVKVFLNFARFPWATVNGSAGGATVFFRDLRFASPDSSHWSFVDEVQLSPSLRIRRQSFSFSRENPEH
jgi:inner membrane protein